MPDGVKMRRASGFANSLRAHHAPILTLTVKNFEWLPGSSSPVLFAQHSTPT